MDIKGKVVIVTGASSGIGEAAAREFGREGAKVVLAARRVDRLQSLAEEIEAMGAEALVVQADLSKLEDIQKLVAQTVEKFGQIDVLVNNAGFGRLDWLENLDPVKDIQAQIDVNVMGVIQTTRQVLPVMMKQRSGSIVNMCSMAGLVGTPTYTGHRRVAYLSRRCRDRVQSARGHQAQDQRIHAQVHASHGGAGRAGGGETCPPSAPHVDHPLVVERDSVHE